MRYASGSIDTIPLTVVNQSLPSAALAPPGWELGMDASAVFMPSAIPKTVVGTQEIVAIGEVVEILQTGAIDSVGGADPEIALIVGERSRWVVIEESVAFGVVGDLAVVACGSG